MEQIAIYLKKFEKIGVEEKVLKETVFSVLNKIFKGRIKEGDVDIKNEVIKIKAHPVIKSELFLRQEEIKITIEREVGKKIDKIR